MLVSRDEWQPCFYSQRSDPNIVDRNHRSSAFEIEVNFGVDRWRECRDLKHLAISNHGLNPRPCCGWPRRFKHAEAKFGKSNKSDREMFLAYRLLNSAIAPQ